MPPRGRISGPGESTGPGRNTNYIRHETGNPNYPYYYTLEDDQGWGYIPDYLDPTNSPRRYRIEDIHWLVSVPQPEVTQETAVTQQSREMTASALEGPIALIYGEDRIGGALFDLVNGLWSVGGTQYSGIAGLYGHGQGEIDSVVHVDLGIEGFNPATLDGAAPNYVLHRFYNGSLTQLADADITSMHNARGEGTVGYRYPGLGYSALFVPWLGAMTHPLNEQYVKPRFTIRGKKLLDPRLGLTGGLPDAPAAWFDSGVLATADYLWNPFYGLGAGLGGIDWASVVDAADYEYENIATGSVSKIVVNNPDANYQLGTETAPPAVTIAAPPGGGVQATAVVTDSVKWNNGFWQIKKITITNPGSGYLAPPAVSFTPNVTASGLPASATAVMGERRFHFNLAIMRSASHKANMDMMRAHYRGYIVKRKGKYRILIDKPRTSVYGFDETNSRPVEVRRAGFSESPNRVIVEYVDPDRDYQTFQAVAETAGVTAGTEAPREARYSLQGCRSAGYATRAAYYLLGKQLLNLFASLVGMKAEQMKYEPLDHVTWTSASVGLSAQDFELLMVGRSVDGQYNVELGMYDESIFSESLELGHSRVSTGLIDPSLPPPPPAYAHETGWLEPRLAFVGEGMSDPARWSAVNVTGFDASKVCDFNEASSCGSFAASSSANYFVFDNGSPVKFNRLRFVLLGAAPTVPFVVVECSNNPAGPWLNAGSSGSAPGYEVGEPANQSAIFFDWDDTGTWGGLEYRYWRVGNPLSNLATADFSEVQLLRITEQLWPYVQKYRLYLRNGQTLVREYDHLPTASEKADFLSTSKLNPFHEWSEISDIYSGSFTSSGSIVIHVAAVDIFDRESPRVVLMTAYASATSGPPGGVEQDWVPQSSDGAALVNGSNVSVPTLRQTGIVVFSGLTAAATVHGLTNGYTGRRLRLLNNTAHNITLANASATEPVANNRFTSADGRDWVMRGGETIDLTYVDFGGGVGRWVVHFPTKALHFSPLGFVGVGGPATQNLDVNNTGLVYARVATSTVGSINEGGVILERGDQANGYCRVLHKTGGTYDFGVGMKAGTPNWGIWSIATGLGFIEVKPDGKVGFGGPPFTDLNLRGAAAALLRFRIGGDGSANNKAMNFAVDQVTGHLYIEEGTGGAARLIVSSIGTLGVQKVVKIPRMDVAPAAGNNHNFGIDTGWVVLGSGAGAAISITGFLMSGGNEAGMEIEIWNSTGQNVSFVPNNAGSSVGNRLQTALLGTLVIPTSGMIRFRYSTNTWDLTTYRV